MTRRMTAIAALALLAAAPAFSATPLDAVVVLDGFVSATSSVRLLNASPDAGQVDLYVAQYARLIRTETRPVRSPSTQAERASS